MAEMRALTERQARNCEEAREPACHCRCGGRLHGAKRGGGSGYPLEFFNGLPEDDPHYLPSEEIKVQKKREKLEAKRKARQEAIDAAQARVNEHLTAYYTANRNGNYELAKQIHAKFVEAQQERDTLYKTRVS